MFAHLPISLKINNFFPNWEEVWPFLPIAISYGIIAVKWLGSLVSKALTMQKSETENAQIPNVSEEVSELYGEYNFVEKVWAVAA